MDHFHPAVEKGQTLRDLKREKTEVIGKSEQDKLICLKQPRYTSIISLTGSTYILTHCK